MTSRTLFPSMAAVLGARVIFFYEAGDRQVEQVTADAVNAQKHEGRAGPSFTGG